MKKFAIAAAIGALALAQQSPHIPADEMTLTARPYSPLLTITAQSNLVQVPVVVRDSYDRAVGSLQPSDFTVTVDGKPQPITGFSIEHAPATEVPPAETSAAPILPAPAKAAARTAARPRSVVWYFDDINSDIATQFNGTKQNKSIRTDATTVDLGSGRQAAQKVLDAGLEPGERIAVYAGSGNPHLDLTTDIEKAKAAVASVVPHPALAAYNYCPVLTVDQSFKISRDLDPDALSWAISEKAKCERAPRPVLADAVHSQAQQFFEQSEENAQATLKDLTAMIQYLARQPGDRVMMMCTGGVITNTLHDLQQQVVNTALHYGVVINAVDDKGLAALGSQGYLTQTLGTEVWDANDAVWGLAEDTGGRFFHDNNDLVREIRESSATPAVSYVLSISPSPVKSDGTYHLIKVKVRSTADTNVQARPGFFAPTPEAGATATDFALQDRISKAVYATDTRSDIPAAIKALPAAGQAEVAVAIDPNALAFAKQSGRNQDTVTFVAALLDAQGEFIAGQQGVMILHLKDNSLATVSKPGVGLTTGFTLKAPPGSYRLRQVIEESGQGRMTTFTQNISIP